MRFRSELGQWKSRRGTVGVRKRQRQRLRPDLMMLEDRQLLSTFTVNSIGDTGSGSGLFGDLRYCITQANLAVGNETILFDSSLFDTPQTITLTQGQLELTNTTGTETITGPAGGVTVDGANTSRVFQIAPNVAASISGLTITGGDAGQYQYGGGVLNYGTTSLTNCTVAGNSGGGIVTGSYSQQVGDTALVNCTVSGNSGGGVSAFYGATSLTNTIVSGQYSGNEIYGGVSGSYNLIGTSDSGGLVDGVDGNIVAPANPGLAPLGLYGGTSPTFALLPGSPAIDAGTTAGSPATDQRGLPRGVAVDIGAFESQGFTVATTSGSGQSASAAFAGPLVVTVSANNPLEPVAGGSVAFTAPAVGASATLSESAPFIGDDGTASVAAASNYVGGSYTVTASVVGAAGTASFDLTNYALVSIALAPVDPTLALGVSGQFLASGTFEDSSVVDISDVVAWSSGSPSIAGIAAGGIATGLGLGTSDISASFSGVMSPSDTLTVIAPSFVVDTTDDSFGFYTGTTSLREAIAGANLVPGQTITFSSGVFGTTQTITLSGTQLDLTNTTGTTTITGPAARLTISGGGLSQVFRVDRLVSASISGLTITGGLARFAYGGGVANYGTASLTNCTVMGNTATHNPAYVLGRGGGGYGGGVFNLGTLTMAHCTVSGNSAPRGGGLSNAVSNISAPAIATLSDCNISGNVLGGGVENCASIDLTDCTVSGNTGTGVRSDPEVYHGADCVATLTNCTVSGNSLLGVLNTAGAYQNNVYNQGLTILTHCTVSGNARGGLSTVGGATTATDTTISNNTNPSASRGAGVSTVGYLRLSGTTTLTNCTVSGNSAAGKGGGLYSGPRGSTTATNTTISNNTAGTGGGLFSGGTSDPLNGVRVSSITLFSCTVSGNSATGAGGGLYNGLLGSTTLENTIVAVNSAGTSGPDARGTVVSNGNNLIGKTDGSSGWAGSDLTGTVAAPLNPLLAALGDYGGPTRTMALLPGSPAINAGTSADAPATDQRGLGRVDGVDIGAFESQGFTLTPASGSTPQTTVVGTSFGNPLAVTVIAKNSVEPVNGGMVTFTPPGSAASATLSGATVVISGGKASVSATANPVVGAYSVSAAANGATSTSFALDNITTVVASATSVGWGSQTYAVAGRKDLPWANISRFVLTFNSPVVPTAADLTVTGRGGHVYAVTGVSVAGNVVTWTLTTPITTADVVTITVNPRLANYSTVVRILPGDANDDGVVNSQDQAYERNAFLHLGPVPVLLVFLDLNGDGVIDVADYNLARKSNGTRL